MKTGFSFSKRALEALEKPKRRTRYRDIGGSHSVKGLVLDAMVSGNKVFRFEKKVNGRNIKVTFGHFPEITVEQARTLAREAAADIAAGINPNRQKQEARDSQTFDDLFAIYVANFELDIKAGKRRESSLTSNKTLYRLHLQPLIGKKSTLDYDRASARALLQKILAQKNYSLHNHALTILKSMYNRAYIENNPFDKIKKIDESVFSRNRTLSKPELKQFLWSLGQEKQIYQDCILLLLITGQRKSMVLSMKWKEIDHDAKLWTIPNSKNKSKKPHVVPLTSEAMNILNRRAQEAEINEEFVFPSVRSASGHITDKSGYGGFWHRITSRIDMYDPKDPEKHLTVHDLRRTLATYQVTSGGSLQATSKLLGHSNISITSNVYAHLSVDGVREALEKTLDYMLPSSEPDKLAKLKAEIDGLSQCEKQEIWAYLTNSVHLEPS